MEDFMKNIAILIFMLFMLSQFAEARTIKIAVIDTGFDFKSTWGPNEHGLVRPKLCKDKHGKLFGHRDFVLEEKYSYLVAENKKLLQQNTEESYERLMAQSAGLNMIRKTIAQDNHGHGTHVTGIIAKHLKDVDYCILVLKYFDPNHSTNNLKNTIKAFEYAVKMNVDYINYSGGGTEYSQKEKNAVMSAIHKGIKIITAAGNERSNSDFNKYYPAQYDPRIVNVGNRYPGFDKYKFTKEDRYGNKVNVVPSSNYGNSVDYYEVGVDVMSLYLGGTFAPMTGTSQAAPKALADEVKRDILKKKIEFYNKTKNVI